MSKSRDRFIGACIAATLVVSAGQAFAQCQTSVGPDVIVGDMPATANFSVVNGNDAFSLATTSCNIGTVNVLWNAFPANTHPAIAQNCYKFSTVNGIGRFEQVGMSWMKHGFTALTGSICCTCQNPGSGSLLGVGCSDPYTAGRNASQGGLGPHWQVNAHTGFFPTGGPAAGTGASGDANYRLLQIPVSKITTTAGGSAAATRFFGESQYVTQDDAAAGNQNNNASYREMAVTGGPTDFTFNFSTAPGSVANTSRQNSAIRAWPLCESGVTLTNMQVVNDGLFIVGSKATNIGGGQWHYEYAVYNMNADRNGGTFVVPLPAGATATNIDFYSPPYHNGDGENNVNFSGTAWTATRNANDLTFATQTQAANNNANAIRWGTTYNFRFDSNAAPVANGNVSVGLWKTGSPNAVFGIAQSPGQLTVPITAAGTASPDSPQITTSALFSVQVFPATNPTSTGITVFGNLTSIHGSLNQPFYDDGTHGDVTANDGTFSYLANLPEPLTAGPAAVTFMVADAQGRTGDGSINFNLATAPSGRCCTSTCSIVSSYACAQSSGVYGGDNTNCGEAGYVLSNGGGAYATIFNSGGTRAATASGCDDCAEPIAMPFSFPFYNNNYTSVNIHSNGYLQFGGSDVEYVNVPIPSAAVPNNAVYPLWDDLNPAQAGDIYYKTNGVSPNRQFIVEWRAVTQYGTNTSENFQAVLFENGNIEFRYGAISADGGGDYTIGIENSTGTEAVVVASNALGTGNTARTITNQPSTNPCPPPCGTADFDGDGDTGTDADIEAFFACLGGNCCATCFAGGADFDGDGDTGTDADIEAFFRVLAGGNC